MRASNTRQAAERAKTGRKSAAPYPRLTNHTTLAVTAPAAKPHGTGCCAERLPNNTTVSRYTWGYELPRPYGRGFEEPQSLF